MQREKCGKFDGSAMSRGTEIHMIEKQKVWDRIDAGREDAVVRGRSFFHCPEMGFEEIKTEEMICRILDEWNVSYIRDVSMTGVIASIGQGEYHIAVAADMDALPRKDGSGCIHSCGHSIQVADALTVLYSLLPYAKDGSLTCRISFFFTPAEELTNPDGRAKLMAEGKIHGRSGKQDMIAGGYFDDVDCVLSCHASGTPGQVFDVGSVLVGFLLKKAVFHGKASHSGGAPHLGRNALNGAILAQTAVSFLKDQFSNEECVRINPMIRDVSGGINIIPAEATMETYVRAANQETLFRAGARFDDCVNGAAMALELTADITTAPGYLPLNQSVKLNKTVEENMLAFCHSDEIGRNPLSGASGDVGDLGVLLPTVQFGFAGVGGVFHSDVFSVEDEEMCYITTAKVMAGTIVDLLNDPERRDTNPDFLKDKEEYIRTWLTD